jgi:hypothetical protein
MVFDWMPARQQRGLRVTFDSSVAVSEESDELFVMDGESKSIIVFSRDASANVSAVSRAPIAASVRRPRSRWSS